MMSATSMERVQHVLCDLIALPSVNPVGRTYEESVPVERSVVEYLEELFAPYSLEVERQPCGESHENLLVCLPGTTDQPGTLLESHMDTVPCDEWADRAFVPRVDDGRVFGLGGCDAKGSLVAMALALLDLLETGQVPPQPVYLLAAGDEEYAQTGIKEFGRVFDRPLGRGIFGEPTENRPVVQHKGTVRWDITVAGRSAHTARPELGRNAILDMMAVIETLSRHEDDLQARHTNPLMTGPTLTVTTIQGGRTRNAVPDECTIAVDLRVLPGMDPAEARQEVIQVVSRVDAEVAHRDVQIMTPPLSTPPDHPFVRGVLDICRARRGQPVGAMGVPYGTDAAWMPGGAPAIVLGPGNVAAAHAPDEYIEVAQCAECAELYRDLVMRDWAGGEATQS